MSDEHRLAVDRASRQAALAMFNERLVRIKADLAARGVGGRVADSLKEGTSDALDAGLDVAKERKGVIAGTLGALLLWIFRAPLFAAGAALLERVRGGKHDETIEDEASDQDD